MPLIVQLITQAKRSWAIISYSYLRIKQGNLGTAYSASSTQITCSDKYSAPGNTEPDPVDYLVNYSDSDLIM